jgi:magnesium chelatase family protein
VQRYLSRVSGPLLDRLDLHVEVPAVRYRDLADRRQGEPSRAIRERVSRAREVQRARFAGCADIHADAHMGARDLREFCHVGEGSEALLRTAITRLGLSARAYHRVLKIARTIADLDGGGEITTAHVSEAIQYRSLDRVLVPVVLEVLGRQHAVLVADQPVCPHPRRVELHLHLPWRS